MPIKDIMTKGPFFARLSDTINDAAQQMKQIKCGVLPVNDDKGECIGMITDRDIVIRVLAKGDDPKQAKIQDAMTKTVHYCYEDDDLNKAADIMRQHKVNRLLVKNIAEHVTGIITFGAMLWKTENASEVGHMLDHAAPRRLAAS